MVHNYTEYTRNHVNLIFKNRIKPMNHLVQNLDVQQPNNIYEQLMYSLEYIQWKYKINRPTKSHMNI